MEEEEEHIKPLAPATQLWSDENEAASHKEKISPKHATNVMGA